MYPVAPVLFVWSVGLRLSNVVSAPQKNFGCHVSRLHGPRIVAKIHVETSRPKRFLCVTRTFESFCRS
jgi:hypothetical protein